MTTYIVSAPEAGYAGKVGDVSFSGGKAVIDDERNPAELAYCRNAGYLVEEDEHAPDSTGQDGTPPDGGKPFDPAEHNAEDVLGYLNDADKAEAVRVLDAEAAGKSRKGITGQREQILDSKKESTQ